MDHNATTPLASEVFDAMAPWCAPGRVANASSVHAEGRAAREAVEAARDQVAAAISGKAREIVFTGGASEANNMVVQSFASRGHIVTTAAEHPSVLEAVQAHTHITVVPVDGRGRVNTDALLQAFRPDTVLCSVLWANNETGVVQDIRALSAHCLEHGAALHVDGAQALGRLDVNVAELGCSLLTLSAHKVYGPQGVGALWIRPGVGVDALLTGGHQERGRRAGTENVAGIVGFGAACSRIAGLLADQPRIAGLRERLWAGLSAHTSAHRNGATDASLPNTLNVSFDGVDGETMLISLDLAGVSVSSGSACTAGSLDPSHVLTAMGLSNERAGAAVRFSLGTQNTAAEVDAAIEIVSDVLSRVRCAA